MLMSVTLTAISLTQDIFISIHIMIYIIFVAQLISNIQHKHRDNNTHINLVGH